MRVGDRAERFCSLNSARERAPVADDSATSFRELMDRGRRQCDVLR